jgi:hypothetical protein
MYRSNMDMEIKWHRILSIPYIEHAGNEVMYKIIQQLIGITKYLQNNNTTNMELK